MNVVYLFRFIIFILLILSNHALWANKEANNKKELAIHHFMQGEFLLNQGNYALAVLFPDNQLRVLDYNRVLRTLNGKTKDEIISALENTFTVDAVSGNSEAKPSNPKQFGMYIENQWYSLKVKQSVSIPNDPVKSLDVSLLQDHVLGPIFGIDNPRTDKNIDFVGGIRGLEELERRCSEDAKVAFAFFPTSVEELINVADAHPAGKRPFSRKEYINKFKSLTKDIISNKESDRFLKCVQNLPKLKAKDLIGLNVEVNSSVKNKSKSSKGIF